VDTDKRNQRYSKPYYGSEMLTCGGIEKNYSSKQAKVTIKS
jgi:hypothetical protein